MEIQEPLQNSVEIGETSKGQLYVKSIKRYFAADLEDAQEAIEMMFATYDQVKEAINARTN